MKINSKTIFLRICGVLISSLPPIIAALSYFPLWKNESGAAALSGLTLALLLIGSAPIFKFLKRILKSPSVCIIWLLIFILFVSLKEIADEMIVISFVGFVSNALGAIIFKLGERKREV